MRITMLAMLPIFAATAAIASEPKAAKQIVKEIVKDAERAPDGTMQPATGRATPVENWFGCKPGQKKDGKCRTHDGGKAAVKN
jgi:hypothetical protein